MKPSPQQIKHAALALGGGIAVALVSIQANVDFSPYVDGAIDGALAFLAGLGIGVVKRAAP